MCNISENRDACLFSKTTTLLLSLSLFLLPAASASANDGAAAIETSSPHASRALTLPGGTLRIDIDQRALGFTSADDLHSPFWSLSLGLAYGFGDTLEVGISSHRLGPDLPSHDIYPAGAPALMLAPYGELGNIPLYIRSQLARTSALEVVLDAGLLFPVQSNFAFDFGVLIRLRLHEEVSLDLGAQYLFVLQGSDADQCPQGSACGDGSTLSLWLPLEAIVQLGPHAFIALETGIELDHYNIERTAIPLGARAGVTLGSARDSVELTLGFEMPRFVRPAAGDSRVTTDLWEVQLLIQSYLGT